MSTWTTPATWSNGAVTAAMMNAEIRDHDVWLKGFADLVTNSTAADTGATTYFQITRAAGTDALIRSLVTGDTGYRFRISAAGSIEWTNGDGVTDLSLARESGAPGYLLLEGDGSTANEPRFGIDYNGTSGDYTAFFIRAAGETEPRLSVGMTSAGKPAFWFGGGASSTPDTSFIRDAAGRIQVGSSTGAARFGTSLGSETGESFSLYSWRTGDTAPRVALGQNADGYGALFLGPGSSTAPDIIIKRTGSSTVTFELGTCLVAGILRAERASASSGVMVGRKTGDGSDNFTLYASGRGVFLDGVTTLVKAGVPDDTDFAFTPTSGTIAVDTTNSDLYVRVGSTWKHVGVA